MSGNNALARSLLMPPYARGGNVFSAPPLLKATVNHLTFHEFFEIYSQAKPDSETILDNKDLIESIIDGDDDGKKLIVALFAGREGGCNVLKTESILKLVNTSGAHKLALLSNQRLNWYDFNFWRKDNQVADEFLVPTIFNGTSEEVSLLISNPRMHRGFIADAIRGTEKAEQIDLSHRFHYALKAIDVQEIKSPEGSSRYAPNDNEMYFHAPFKAFLVVLRELFSKDMDWQRLLTRHLDFLIGLYAKEWHGIDDRDWLSPEEAQKAGSLTEWKEKTDFVRTSARVRFVEWAASLGKNEPLEVNVNRKELDPLLVDDPCGDFIKGTFATLLCLQTFRQLDAKIVDPHLSSESWCVRAAAYGAMYEAGAKKNRNNSVQYTKEFLRKYSSDSYALIRGLSLVPSLWKTCDQIKDFYAFPKLAQECCLNIDDDTLQFCEYRLCKIIFPEYQQALLNEEEPLPENPGDKIIKIVENLSQKIQLVERKIDYVAALICGCIVFGLIAYNGYYISASETTMPKSILSGGSAVFSILLTQYLYRKFHRIALKN